MFGEITIDCGSLLSRNACNISRCKMIKEANYMFKYMPSGDGKKIAIYLGALH